MRALSISVLALCFVSCRPAERPNSSRNPDPVRITQFYATSFSTPRGESTNLCYGVDNATAVRIDPPVESLKPALSRCISVAPAETTTYTLTAEDQAGKSASQAVTVKVTGPLPHFDELRISSKEIAAGESVQFCFKAKNAVAVHGGPGHFFFGGKPKGDCLDDKPLKTTTYSLKIEGAGGETDEASVTVKVK